MYQDTAHSYDCATKKCVRSNYLAVTHDVSCVQKWLIWIYAALFGYIPCWRSLTDRNM